MLNTQMDRIEMLLSLILRSQDEQMFRLYVDQLETDRDWAKRVDISNQRMMYERAQREKNET